jgi:1,4-dihydroxy-2-naphthoate octaprenyltransferase
MNVAMWTKAFRRMPRVTPAEWAGLDVVARWLLVTRAAVLPMTLMAAVLAGLMAAAEGAFRVRFWLVSTVGVVLAHATNNLLNDLTDHLKGTDKGGYFRTRYGVQPLEQGVLTPRQFFLYVAITGGAALGAGAYLVATRGEFVLPLFGVGIFFVLFYTYPLKYFGLGEVAVIAVWGPLMVGGIDYVVTGTLSLRAVVVGTAYALGPTQVIFGKHIDKLGDDSTRRIRTLPVILGERLSRAVVVALMGAQYVLILVLVAKGLLRWPALLVFLALPFARKCARVYGRERPSERPKRWMEDVWPLWFSAWSFVHSARFGALLVLGLGLGLLLPR